jgi:hypothetical protein
MDEHNRYSLEELHEIENLSDDIKTYDREKYNKWIKNDSNYFFTNKSDSIICFNYLIKNILYIFLFCFVVSGFFCLGYGSSFLSKNYSEFHENGECDGSKLWNISLGSVTTVMFNYFITIYTIYNGLYVSWYKLNNLNIKNNMYIIFNVSSIVMICYHMIFIISYHIQLSNLHNCGSLLHTNLGTYCFVMYYYSIVILSFTCSQHVLNFCL